MSKFHCRSGHNRARTGCGKPVRRVAGRLVDLETFKQTPAHGRCGNCANAVYKVSRDPHRLG